MRMLESEQKWKQYLNSFIADTGQHCLSLVQKVLGLNRLMSDQVQPVVQSPVEAIKNKTLIMINMCC